MRNDKVENSYYALVYDDPGDEEKDEDTNHPSKDALRERFIEALKKEGLLTTKVKADKLIFIKVSTTLERLYQEAQTLRIELPLKGLVLHNPLEKEDTIISKKMKKLLGGVEIGTQITAPFQSKRKKLFRNSNDKNDPILWSSVRCLLVHNIITTLNVSKYRENGELPEKIDLPYLLKEKVFKSAFPLHDPSVLERTSLSLMSSYSRNGQEVKPKEDLRREIDQAISKVCGKKPVQEVRNYFGEKIAFYFAWVSTFTASLWFPAILGIGVFVFGIFQHIRRGIDIGQFIRSTGDNELTPLFAAIICLWGTIFTEVWKRKQISLARQWYVDNYENVEPDRPCFQGTKTQINPFTLQPLQYYPFQRRMLHYIFSIFVMFIMVLVVIGSVMLVNSSYSDQVCPKDKDNKSTCGFIKSTLVPTVLNAVSIKILGVIYEFIAIKLNDWENHQTLSAHNDHLIVKLFVVQFFNSYTSLFYMAFFSSDNTSYNDWYGDCNSSDKSYTSQLSFQLLVLILFDPLPKFIVDVIWPCIKRCFHCTRNVKRRNSSQDKKGIQQFLLREFRKSKEEDFRLGEFSEKMIQYGYLMMFAASFPLAPALVLLFNLIDTRFDFQRLLWWDRRPTPFRDDDIGIWLKIINFINICGVVSNAFLIAYSSEIGCYMHDYGKSLVVILFEHFVFLFKFLLSTFIPNVPAWVINSHRKERYLVSYLMSNLKESDDEDSDEEDGNKNHEDQDRSIKSKEINILNKDNIIDMHSEQNKKAY